MENQNRTIRPAILPESKGLLDHLMQNINGDFYSTLAGNDNLYFLHISPVDTFELMLASRESRGNRHDFD